ncbi:uncharacterized protein LOC105848735 [Hydra vulgaris]|uniref:uncharacterized protein LOC105848735 n=1 Tax=Hydra vulgaris TaxID=6087 RepID=UPI00019259E7|nr:uncharacterized protein LOC105848735 [Hydra vulgaris]XP_047141628.1 uncharacterized protein LOC105848735 [Hydra vulgaris]XP_047141629.1 uncharacterized protein LOC105848735 [Hydra vulgaris]XP_047141630.1 uncharacterized protein LOC105848735 [Hydra vulgaris]XP_047141631.1 uncharacterized protein LOC105848735 [Hydra vulgaris]XP_047141632.1 uncharacterized protein LOC105848735 [Hydra vulgaris]XP_047141633.1 uncharacterized protein LOC105848735 [Hydra vulgaris]XP_047141634.1 uncharacterized p
MLQIQNGSQFRRELHQERLRGYEEKLASNEWTATKFLEAASFLCKNMKMPSDQEVQELIEQEQIVDEESQSNGQAAVVDRPIKKVRKVCLVNNLRVVVFPSRYLCQCQRYAKTMQSSATNYCPVCRGPTADFINVFI